MPEPASSIADDARRSGAGLVPTGTSWPARGTGDNTGATSGGSDGGPARHWDQASAAPQSPGASRKRSIDTLGTQFGIPLTA